MLANNEDLDTTPSQGKAWDPYRQVMKDTAARHGAPLLDIPTLFTESGLSKEALFLDEMHPTAEGHRLMGEALTALLEKHSWPESPLMGDGVGGSIPGYEDPYVSGGSVTGNDPGANPDDPGASGDPGANPGDPGGNAMPGDGPRIGGELSFSGYTAGTIQIEVVKASEANGNPTVLGSDRLEGPGSFSLDVRDAASVVLRVYLDEDMNGPDAGDRRFDSLSTTVITVADPGANALVVDLDAGTVTSGG